MRTQVRSALLISAVTAAFGQPPTGAIDVLVETASTTPVAGAAVRIVELATGRSLEFTTNQAGRYAAGNLLPGRYNLRIEAPGFQMEEVDGIALEAAMVYDARIQLRPGNTEFVATAYARAATVESLSHTVATNINATEIRNYPLIGRNFLDLASLAPGVEVRGGGSLDPTKAGLAYRAVGIAGRAGAGTKIQYEGIDITDPVVGGSAVNVSPEAVHEFQVSQSSLDPSAPATSTGAIQIIGVRGGNRFHGTGLFTYFGQNLSARQSYDAAATPFDREQGAVSAGGPLLKNRLFWFVTVEKTWQTTTANSTNPLFPQLTVRQSEPASIRYASGRVDWVVNATTTAFVNFLNDANLTTSGLPSSLYNNANWSASAIAGVEVSRGRSSYSYRFGHTNFNDRAQWTEGKIRFPRTPQGDAYQLAVGTAQYGLNNNAPASTGQATWQSHLGASHFLGRHSLRMGVSVSRLEVGEGPRIPPLVIRGDYNAATIAQVIARGGDPQSPLEFPLSSFSMGAGAGYLTLASGHGFPHGGEHDTRIGAYMLYSVRLRRLTFSTAIRWDYATEFYPNDHRVARDPKFDRWIAGASEWPRSPRDLFSPRLGFAWEPRSSGKTVIRGGFSKANDLTLKNPILVDQLGLVPAALGPAIFSDNLIAGPNGIPIDIDGKHPAGTYSDLRGRPIKDVLATIGQVKRAVSSAFSAYVPRPGVDVNVFTATRGSTGGFFPGNHTKAAYSLQFNIGVQRQLRPGIILTVDYVRNRGIGLPILGVDYDREFDAGYLDVAAAGAQIGRVLAGRTVDQWIASNPRGTIASFGLFTDAVWPGITPDFIQALFQARGLTLYRALAVSLRGSSGVGSRWFRDLNYLLTYSLSRTQASSLVLNPENGSNAANSRNWNSPDWFGPVAFDHTHTVRALLRGRIPGGIDLTAQAIFQTPSPDTLFFPLIGPAASSQGYPFIEDLNGDGRATDLLPGVTAGQFGRKVRSLQDVNRAIQAYNGAMAGTFTPHGEALIAAGLFTADQLRRLSGVTPAIPLIPDANPSPWHNLLTVNVRVQRMITWKHSDGSRRFGPTLDVLNLFNHAPSRPYSGLAGLFGQLNYDYANAPPGRRISDLYSSVGRLNPTRQLQIGIRFEF